MDVIYIVRRKIKKPKKVEFWDLVEESIAFQSELEKGLPVFQY